MHEIELSSGRVVQHWSAGDTRAAGEALTLAEWREYCARLTRVKPERRARLRRGKGGRRGLRKIPQD